MLELIIIAVYFTGMIAIGLVSWKRAKEADDFFVAGRKGSTLFITGSLLATIVGGSATVGMAGRGFSQGLTGAWWLLVGSVGLVILAIFFAKKVRDFGLYTLPELVEKQYDKRVALAGSILIVIAWVGIIAAQIAAAGTIMSVLGIGSPLLWMVLFTIVFVAYAVLGGQHAIVRTDTIQTVVIFAGNFPKKTFVVEMKKAGKKTISFASTKSIAEQMIRLGIDALILEGSEAGGHIGYVSLIILLQQVLFEVSEVPIFVAGGIAKGTMIAHLLLMGASGCQLGTRFVLSEECTAHPDFKKAFIKAKAREAIATPQYDSKLPVVAVRAIKNKGMENFGKLQLRLIRELQEHRITRNKAQYEVENYWVGSLRNAVLSGDTDLGSLMAGQSVGLVGQIMPIKDIFQELLNDAEEELARIQTLF